MSKPMSIEDIIRTYLEAAGFDGLYSDDCGCWLGDLFPCGEPNIRECYAGYKRVAEWDPDDFIVGPEKEEHDPIAE